MFVVIVLLLLIVPFFVNADSFRPMLQSKAQEALGRNVQIGKLGFSLFSGSLSADGITIADDPKFSNAPFISAKSLKISVDVMPLIFSKELHVNSIKLEQPQVALISNAAGTMELFQPGRQCRPAGAGRAKARAADSATDGAESLPSPLPTYAVDEIDISDGKISISEVPAKQPAVVYTDVDLTLKKFAPGAKMPFTLSLKAPRGGTIKADGTAGPINPNDASLTPVQLDLKNDSVEIAGLAPTSGMSGLLDMNAKVQFRWPAGAPRRHRADQEFEGCLERKARQGSYRFHLQDRLHAGQPRRHAHGKYLGAQEQREAFRAASRCARTWS